MFKKIIIVMLSVVLLLGLINLGFIIRKRIMLKNHPYKYKELVQEYSKEYKLDPLLVLAVIKVESDFNKDATSEADARGLMQIIDSTAGDIAKALEMENFKKEDLYKADININMGCYYLGDLYKQFNDWDSVIAAYNGGRGNVTKWLKDDEYSKDGKLTNIPFKETEKYLKSVNKEYKIYIELYR